MVRNYTVTFFFITFFVAYDVAQLAGWSDFTVLAGTHRADWPVGGTTRQRWIRIWSGVRPGGRTRPTATHQA